MSSSGYRTWAIGNREGVVLVVVRVADNLLQYSLSVIFSAPTKERLQAAYATDSSFCNYIVFLRRSDTSRHWNRFVVN